ncbi:hypothetical protein [Lelliottia wanjuensis]|uniref:Uncharacterized protein n=1 Tax=Lelliottia wanjuensis TaxID=3050585 RepID=A0AAP4FZA6_9ENTR|nr:MULTISPECIES: hypothetical protein [unclassified Lelliottia]MDK9366442.1 hypothetical protein [Lelliottia sp. V106_12]MDK9618689.1 hypothetical protein [Lelliottia sp. V106_9]
MRRDDSDRLLHYIMVKDAIEAQSNERQRDLEELHKVEWWWPKERVDAVRKKIARKKLLRRIRGFIIVLLLIVGFLYCMAL